MTNQTPARTYPLTVACDGVGITIRPMTSADRAGLVALVAQLPEHDLLFLKRDITHPKVIDAWMRATETGELHSLVAWDGASMIGCTAIFTDDLSWSRHVGELRILTSPAWRGRGLGRLMMQECFIQALGLGLKKLVAQMTLDQRGGISVFEDMGFKAEALLAAHVADRAGRLHDLVLLSHHVDAVSARKDAFGLTEALGS
ncbi:MAG: GNAT family N-acetyltransferase [Acidovorax sp.]|uniref:GNAT family N-acetyltransferase n=1 Tax=Acidovorax sp. TaxID=1872122 RepID=UPI0039E3B457